MRTLKHGPFDVLLCDDGSVQVVNQIDMRIKIEPLEREYGFIVSTDPATGRFAHSHPFDNVRCWETRRSIDLRALGK